MFHFCLNLFVELDLFLNQQQSEDADIKRKTDTFTISEESGNEGNHSCLTFTKRRSKNHRGNHQNQ